MTRSSARIATRIASLYAIVAGSWMILSDVVLDLVAGRAMNLLNAQTVKDAFFILGTAVFLYVLTYSSVLKVERSQRALDAADALLRAIIDSSPVAIVVQNDRAEITLWNRAAEGMFGWMEEEVLGTNNPVVPSEFREEYQDRTTRALEGADSVDTEVTRVRRDGSPIQVRVSTAPVRDDEGNIVGVVGTLIDISQRKRAEEALRHSEQVLRTLVEAAPAAIVAMGPDLNVTLWNPSAEKLFGWTAEEVLGGRLPLVPLGGTPRFNDNIARVLAGESVMSLEIECITKEGGSRACDLFGASVRGPRDEPMMLMGLMVDCEERKRLEQLKSDFATIVSHELRTPLTTIIGYGDLLKKLDIPNDPELAREIVSKLRVQSARMKDLVEELLEVSQMQARQVALDIRRTDVAELVRACVEEVTFADGHEISVSTSRTAMAEIDPGRVERACSNLLQNAVKYSPDGGEIRVSVSRKRGTVHISVSDQGIGVDEGALGSVFDKFTQADMSSTRKFGGFGLGLYIVKGIAEAHGGTVDVESEPGKGSTFTMILPVKHVPSDRPVEVP